MVDDGLSPEDSEIDGLLRDELGRTLPHEGPAADVLLALAPAAKRARRKRVAGQVVLGAAASLVFVAGIGLAMQARSLPGQNVTAAGESDDDGQATVSVSTTEGDGTSRSTLEVSDLGTTVTTVVAPAEQPTTTLPDSTETSAPTEPSNITTSAVTTASSTPSSTDPSVTSVTVSPGAETRLATRCGTVVVSVDDDRITLVEVEPDPGYSVDTKSSGPEKVEVGFNKGEDECELKVEVENGELEIEGDE